MSKNQKVISTTSAVLLCVAVGAQRVGAVPGELDRAYLRPQLDCYAPSLLTDNGSTYVYCTTILASPKGSPGQYIARISKFDKIGKLDSSWGSGGVASVWLWCPQTGGCPPSHGNVFGTNDSPMISARDGGIVIGDDASAFKLDRFGRRVEEFNRLGNFGRTPPSGIGQGAVYLGGDEDPSGEFIHLWTRVGGSQYDGTMNQTFAVVRFRADGSYERTTEFGYNLTQETSGTSIYPKLWGLSNEKLQIAFVSGTPGRWKLIELGTGSAPVSFPFQINRISDPKSRSTNLAQLPNGSLVDSSSGWISQWRYSGELDMSFGPPPGGGVALSDGSEACIYGPYFQIHAGPTYSIKTSGYKAGSFSCGGPSSMYLTDSSGQRVGSPTPAVFGGYFAVDAGGGYLNPQSTSAYGSDVHLTRFEGFGPLARVKVIEYHTPLRDRYFMTAIPEEVDGVDKLVSEGWQRSGRSFGAWNIETPMPGTKIVCRFYALDEARNGTYFQSADEAECNGLRALELSVPSGQAGWRFDKNAFRITLPVNGQCSNGLSPVVRFNNGQTGPVGLPNYRYVTREPDIEEMIAKGWINEGVHMCAVL